MLLNTDWSRKGNEKMVGVVAGHERWELSVKERTVVLVRIADGKMNTEIAEL